MKEIVIPTLSNCQQLCIQANKDWQNVIKESTKNALAIIDWRVHYSQLDNFDLPAELLNVIDIQCFKQTYEQSAYLYYKLLEEKVLVMILLFLGLMEVDLRYSSVFFDEYWFSNQHNCTHKFSFESRIKYR